VTECAVGDVVQLKSGGPRMTVECVTVTKIRVVWFIYQDGWSKACRDEFDPLVLKMAAAPREFPKIKARAKRVKTDE
jgi:uncharacterized protein YodC (DUF2158 family)